MRGLMAILMVLPVIIPAPSHAQTNIAVDELLTELQRTLILVRDAVNDENLPPLSKATLNLKSRLKKVADGQASLFIIEMGAEVVEESVLEVRLELEPPLESDSVRVSSVSDLLADAIIKLATAVQRARQGKPPLHLHKLTAAVHFVVSSNTEGGAGFSILPAVKLSGGVETQDVQELIVEFRG